GHGHRPRDVLPREGRLLRGPDRGGSRRHRERPTGHQPLPVPGASRGGRVLMATVVPPDTEPRLALYRTMQECRLFETRAQEVFFEGLVRGTTHLGGGQE